FSPKGEYQKTMAVVGLNMDANEEDRLSGVRCVAEGISGPREMGSVGSRRRASRPEECRGRA
ncbi:MAG: hypothetical protein Q8R28_02505, partial [Dehalococcoidia bacterium]|nr:hypothetical protein [Dehalococcoidia bacterium]